jgi:hypothetical protein
LYRVSEGGIFPCADAEELGCAGFVRLRKCEVCESFECVAPYRVRVEGGAAYVDFIE